MEVPSPSLPPQPEVQLPGIRPGKAQGLALPAERRLGCEKLPPAQHLLVSCCEPAPGAREVRRPLVVRAAAATEMVLGLLPAMPEVMMALVVLVVKMALVVGGDGDGGGVGGDV